MMGRRFVLSLFALGLLASCHSVDRKSTPPESARAWPEHMQGFAKSVSKLAPYVYSARAYSDPQNGKEISARLKEFSGLAHTLKAEMGEKIVGSDPLVRYSLGQLKGDISRAQESFEIGSLDYSRGVMKNALNHCFRCHSLNDPGSKATLDWSSFKNLPLSPLERVDLLVASRQFDQAKQLLEGLMKDPEYVMRAPFDFESALRRYLALMVRVKRDPKATLAELENLDHRKEVPFYVQEHLHSWIQSLSAWSHEKPTKTSLLDQARARMKAAQRLQGFAKDHSGDVEYLRVTNMLHDYLKTAQSPADTAEAFSLLGQSYEVLDELGYWNLHEVYYEACIRALPKTDRARGCFRRLQSSIYLGFSGSSGVHIPQSERERLNELKPLL